MGDLELRERAARAFGWVWINAETGWAEATRFSPFECCHHKSPPELTWTTAGALLEKVDAFDAFRYTHNNEEKINIKAVKQKKEVSRGGKRAELARLAIEACVLALESNHGTA